MSNDLVKDAVDSPTTLKELTPRLFTNHPNNGPHNSNILLLSDPFLLLIHLIHICIAFHSLSLQGSPQIAGQIDLFKVDQNSRDRIDAIIRKGSQSMP